MNKSSITDIRVRRTEFPLPKEKYYFRDNAVLTHFVNALHIVFPEGERMFIRAVREFAGQVTDETLKEAVKAFYAQETQHANQHARYYAHLDAQGLGATEIYETYKNLMYDTLEVASRKYLGGKTILYLTAALEHYTAIFAEFALEARPQVLDGMPADFKELIRWHAMEEMEHKAVAYEVLNASGNNILRRYFGMGVAISLLFSNAIVIGGVLMRNDKELTLSRLVQDGIKALPDVAATLAFIAAGTIDYLRPDFHPDDTDHRAILERVRRESNDFKAWQSAQSA